MWWLEGQFEVMPNLAHYIGERLYRSAYPIYRFGYRRYKQVSDRFERALLAKHLGIGDVVVDAGANIGIYSEFLCNLVGPSGAVHSFEPSPQNFARLKKATAKFTNIYANEMAVGKETGESLLYVSNSLNVDHRTYSPPGPARPAIPIKTVALDDYFNANEKVDFIKMDVQGYEFHALLGASRTIAENRDLKMLLEFWPYGLKEAGVEPVAVADFLAHHGFALFTVVRSGLVPFDSGLADEIEIDFYRNVFASRDSTRNSAA